MIFEKYTKFGDLGLTSMLCAKISNRILVYGGSNFPNGTPPYGTRVVHNTYYLFDDKFNLIKEGKGKIFPDRGITLEVNGTIYFISGMGNTKIYKYTLLDDELIEEEILDLGFEIVGGFGIVYENSIYFGKEKLYKLDLKTNILEEKKEFIGSKREQSVYFLIDNNIYVLGGASDICHLDSYKYDILKDEWLKLPDLKHSLTAASFLKLDENRVLICGGSNKEIYDDAVQKLADIEFKKKYFSMSREEFNWNKNIYVYDKNEELTLLGKSDNTATCGSTMLKVGDCIYLVNGEIKPGYRSNEVLRCKL